MCGGWGGGRVRFLVKAKNQEDDYREGNCWPLHLLSGKTLTPCILTESQQRWQHSWFHASGVAKHYCPPTCQEKLIAKGSWLMEKLHTSHPNVQKWLINYAKPGNDQTRLVPVIPQYQWARYDGCSHHFLLVCFRVIFPWCKYFDKITGITCNFKTRLFKFQGESQHHAKTCPFGPSGFCWPVFRWRRHENGKPKRQSGGRRLDGDTWVTDRLQGSLTQSVIHALITRQKYESRRYAGRQSSWCGKIWECVFVWTCVFMKADGEKLRGPENKQEGQRKVWVASHIFNTPPQLTGSSETANSNRMMCRK